MIDEFENLAQLSVFEASSKWTSQDAALETLLYGNIQYSEFLISQILKEKTGINKTRPKKNAFIIYEIFKKLADNHLSDCFFGKQEKLLRNSFELKIKDFTEKCFLNNADFKKYLNQMRHYNMIRVQDVFYGGKIRIMLNPQLVQIGYVTTERKQYEKDEFAKIDDLDENGQLKLKYVKKKVENEKTFSGLKVIKDEQ